jgi:hypothetical protein
MTPKEALKGIKQAIAEHLHLKTGVSVEKHFEYLQYDTEIDIVEQALTELEELKRYPTADEVCEALGEFYKWKVSYSNERYNHMFYFEESKLGVLRFMNNGVYFIQSDYHKTNDLPPHLITLLGRFYENEVKKK